MNTQNMKLLELETGKYLELGKDFYYGGDSIIIEPYNIASNIMSFFFECFKDANSINEGMIFLQKKALENKQNNISDDVIMNVLHQTEPQEPLKTLCEKVGAVVYGGRYVLALNTMCEYSIMYKITYADSIIAQIPRNFEYDQHIYSNVIKNEPKYFSDTFICKEKDYLQTIKRIHGINDNTMIEILQVNNGRKVDILREYLKQLRNEPNQFDELKELLK